MLFGDFFKDSILVDAARIRRWPSWPRNSTAAWRWRCMGSTAPPFWLALAGVALAWFLYLKRPGPAGGDPARASARLRLLENKYCFDWFNEHVLSRGARALGTALWKGGDSGVIDGVFVNGCAQRDRPSSAGRRAALQSGYIYHYALVMIVGVFGLLTWQLLAVSRQPDRLASGTRTTRTCLC